MNDLTSVIRPFVVILLVIVMYIFVVQLMNDPACAVMDRNVAPILGEGFVKFIALCWW